MKWNFRKPERFELSNIFLLLGCVPPPYIPVQNQQTRPLLPCYPLCAAICSLLCLAQPSNDNENAFSRRMVPNWQGSRQILFNLSGIQDHPLLEVIMILLQIFHPIFSTAILPTVILLVINMRIHAKIPLRISPSNHRQSRYSIKYCQETNITTIHSMSMRADGSRS